MDTVMQNKTNENKNNIENLQETEQEIFNTGRKNSKSSKPL